MTTYEQGRNHVFKVEGPFLGIVYYYPSTGKKIDRSTQVGAVGYIITLYSSKSWGSVKISEKSGPSSTPSGYPMYVSD